MWWWNGPMWGGWGMPWWMLIFPLLFVLGFVFMAYVCMWRGFTFWYCGGRQIADTSQALLEEKQKLRWEFAGLRAEIKK